MFLSSFKSYSFLAVLLLFFSCGKNTDQEIRDTILEANIFLSSSQCQPAIDLLESIGRQNTDAHYLKTLSSAYACRAGYSSIVFFAEDIGKTSNPPPLGGMTTYTTSLVPVGPELTNNSNFRDLQTAIDILLYAGGISELNDPTVGERAKRFSLNQAGDINAQLIYMMLVQTGKFMKFYANTDNSGKKRSSIGLNNCFLDYTGVDVNLDLYLAGNGGACKLPYKSHPKLVDGATDRRKKLCEGVVLLNGILEILPIVLATASGGNLDDISSLTDDIKAVKKTLEDYDVKYSPTANVLSQKKCETINEIDEDTLTYYYAVFFESLVK